MFLFENDVFLVGTIIFLFGNDMFSFENDMFHVGNDIFQSGNCMSLLENAMFVIGNIIFLFGYRMCLLEQNMFLFGIEMVLFGYDMFFSLETIFNKLEQKTSASRRESFMSPIARSAFVQDGYVADNMADSHVLRSHRHNSTVCVGK